MTAVSELRSDCRWLRCRIAWGGRMTTTKTDEGVPTQREVVEAIAIALQQTARWRRAALADAAEYARRDTALLGLEQLLKDVAGLGSGVVPPNDEPIEYPDARS